MDIPAEKTILLVEDNPDDIELTIRALKKANIKNELIIARDGCEALDFLLQRGDWEDKERTLPQLVLLDLKLPRLSGLEVLKEIRANPSTRYLPVVILSSSGEEEDLVQGYQLGANSYVRKPVDFSQFVAATRELGMYWLVLNQTPRVGGDA